MKYLAAALYVDPKGHYPQLAAIWLDLAKDARTYTGPLPIVAHPPCAPWSRLHAFSKGEGRDCGPIAVEQVRKHGGILEHPADSNLFKHCNLPRPGELFEDSHGGYTVALYQGDYGHPAPKLTWLYCVRTRLQLSGQLPAGGQKGRVMQQHSRYRSLTPADLAHRLLNAAQEAA